MSTAASEEPVGRRGQLWFGLLGGAVAWTAHLMLAYLIAEFGCLTAAGHRAYLGLTAVTWAVLGVSAATLLVALAATLVAERNRRRLPPYEGDARPGAYVAYAGVILSGMFSFVILVESLPILFYLRDC